MNFYTVASSYQDTNCTLLKNLDFMMTGLLWELSLPQNFVVAQWYHFNDRSSSSLVLGNIYLCLRHSVKTPILWPPDARSRLIGKDPDAGKECRQKEKRVTKDWMLGWHHRFNGHELGRTPGDSERLESLAAVHGVADTTCRLNNYNIPVSVHWHRSTKFIKADSWADALAHV